MFEILTTAEMKKAEDAAITAGTSATQLMENAGFAVAQEIMNCLEPCETLVLCGPGNNGGDGFIIAHHLKKNGWPVRVACKAKKTELKGSVAQAAKKWDGAIESLNSNLSVHQTKLVVDAIYGTGFNGQIDPETLTLFDKIRTRKIGVVAVDLPSGVDAATGSVAHGTLQAQLTVTFGRKKIAHVLHTSKFMCGRIIVSHIGVADADIESVHPTFFENHPALWLKDYPLPTPASHKYARGYVMVYGGDDRPGAAILAAEAAQRTGAGVVSFAVSSEKLAVYQTARASIMADAFSDEEDFKALLRDERKTALVIGCGAGANERLENAVLAALPFNKAVVLDGDVFTAFKGKTENLFKSLTPKHILTPHEGEFERLFPDLDGDKLSRARVAAKKCGAIVVLKGADTIIAAPDGTAIIQHDSPATLATAGSGDVLAGLIGGFASQGMTPFMAAAAGVWLHAEAARKHGLGLTAEDIISQISQTLNDLFCIAPRRRIKF